MKLYNVEEHYKDTITKKSRHVATNHWQKPYALAKSLKRLEELKNKPKGTYHKIK